MVKFLLRFKESKRIKNLPRLKRLITLLVDFHIEAFEVFNALAITSWGVWCIICGDKFTNPIFQQLYLPNLLFGYIAFFIGLFCIYSLVFVLNNKKLSIKLRKRSMFYSSMFWCFIFCLFVIYHPFSPSPPVYSSLMIFCLWINLRLTSYHIDINRYGVK